jgi:hypothetical protein
MLRIFKNMTPIRGLLILLALLSTVIVIGCFVPGPIEGVWSSKILNCMCHSTNRVELKNGTAVLSSYHTDAKSRGPRGTYSKENGIWVWRLRADHPGFELHPTWFTLRLVNRTDGESVQGFRILWPPAIRDARSKQVPK